MADPSLIWEIIKFALMVIVIPFGVWIVKSNMDTKKELSTLKEDQLKFRAEVIEKYAPKQDVSNLSSHIDAKLTAMQAAVTQRIDTMQANIATMIASINKP